MFRFIKYLVAVLCLGLLFVVAQAQAVDINTATATELATIKGIGPKKAEAIVKYRNEHGAFQSVDDLMKVPGIKAKTLANIKDQVSVGGAAGTTGLPKAPVNAPPMTKPAMPTTPEMPATKPAMPAKPAVPAPAPATKP